MSVGDTISQLEVGKGAEDGESKEQTLLMVADACCDTQVFEVIRLVLPYHIHVDAANTVDAAPSCLIPLWLSITVSLSHTHLTWCCWQFCCPHPA